MPDDWREVARERYCGILLDQLETASTFEEREAIRGRIEWLLEVRGAEDPDEPGNGHAIALSFREVEWRPTECRWPGCGVVIRSLAELRAHMAEHEAGSRRIPVTSGDGVPPVFDGPEVTDVEG